MRYVLFFTWLLLSSFAVLPANLASATDTCSLLVNTALDATHQLCNGTFSNQVCYGHHQVEAEPQPGFGPFRFAQSGDKLDVVGLQSLRLSPMRTTTEDWGVAWMRVAANLPGTKSVQDVTFLALGDVQIFNQVRGTNPIEVTIASVGNVNVRQAPTLNAYVLGTLASGQTVTARGRLADNSWIFIDLPDQQRMGWVYAPSLSRQVDMEQLAVVDPATAYYAPMQAFYLETQPSATPTCTAAPENGLMIQTEEGVAEVSLWINEVKIRMGSTAYVRAQYGDRMTVTMLQGHAEVEAFGVSQTALAGAQVVIPLNDAGLPSAPPLPPRPFVSEEVQALPIALLPRQIPLVSPLTSDVPSIRASNSGQENGSDTCPGNSCAAPGHAEECPGNSCNTPGHGGECPGNSCNAPGHAEECTGNSCNASGQGGECSGNSCNTPGHGAECPGNSCNAPGHH